VLIALLILLLAGAVGTALYFQTSSLTGTASSGVLLTTRTSPLEALRESMIVLKSEGWS
jgi:hypothetical protein